SEGAVWAFVRSGAGWIQQGPKLTGIGGESPIGRALGRSVALSSDGNTALAGGPYADWPNPEGAAWVFTRAGATWTQQGERLKYGEPPEGEDVRFGMSVALSGTGDSA